MIAGFARLQTAENALVPQVLRAAGVDWVLELAPASSPSPAVRVPRHRMLLDGREWIWPCRSPAGRLPFVDDSVPAILVRHVFWLPGARDLLAEAVRCLKPGGLLVSVSANPWHRRSWQEIGTSAFQLPAWPRFLMQHGRHHLLLEVPQRDRWRGLVPGIAPLLVVAGRKPPRGATVRRLRMRHPLHAQARPVPTSCRAA